VLLIVAALAKMLDVRRASTWSTAAGRIVKADTQARRHRFAGEATTVKTVPVVEYEFSQAVALGAAAVSASATIPVAPTPRRRFGATRSARL
jgi:hypothetical protein